MPTTAPVKRPATWVDTLPIVTEVDVTPVRSWNAVAGIGGADEPLAVLLVELVEEHAVRSPTVSTRQMTTVESGVRRIRGII